MPAPRSGGARDRVHVEGILCVRRTVKVQVVNNRVYLTTANALELLVQGTPSGVTGELGKHDGF